MKKIVMLFLIIALASLVVFAGMGEINPEPSLRSINFLEIRNKISSNDLNTLESRGIDENVSINNVSCNNEFCEATFYRQDALRKRIVIYKECGRTQTENECNNETILLVEEELIKQLEKYAETTKQRQSLRSVLAIN